MYFEYIEYSNQNVQGKEILLSYIKIYDIINMSKKFAYNKKGNIQYIGVECLPDLG